MSDKSKRPESKYSPSKLEDLLFSRTLQRVKREEQSKIVNSPRRSGAFPSLVKDHITTVEKRVKSSSSSLPSIVTKKQRSSSSKKRSATRKIGRFFNAKFNKARWLSFVCPTSGECVSFGKKIDEITKFFFGYAYFDFVVDSVKQIGVKSTNGFVKEIKFERVGYVSYAILKSSMRANSDNLVYEYIVGMKMINPLLRTFPCFLQTYGHYYYKDEQHWKTFLTHELPLSKKNLIQALARHEHLNLRNACLRSKYAAILIQHIHSATTLHNNIKNESPTQFAQNNLLYVLFIIYHALSRLSTNFTHYDLHSSNVLLYEPSNGKYIQYHYHLLDGTIITFRCPFIPKIIDYGRSYFKTDSLSSTRIFEYIKSYSECQPRNGYKFGFQWFQPEDEYFIISQKKNESHDLRLLVTIKHIFDSYTAIPLNNHHAYKEIFELLESLQYGVGIEVVVTKADIEKEKIKLIKEYTKTKTPSAIMAHMEQIEIEAKEKAEAEAKANTEHKKNFGTREDTTLHPNGSITANVTDAYVRLKRSVLKASVMFENLTVYNDESNKFADFHIYEDGRSMEFIPVQSAPPMQNKSTRLSNKQTTRKRRETYLSDLV
jgi:hypothetical protein